MPPATNALAEAIKGSPWVSIRRRPPERSTMRRAQTDGMLTKADLRARGWTAADVSQFLGEADRTALNPRRRSGPPICYFHLRRVEAAETSTAFLELRATRKARSERSKLAAEKQAAELLAEVEAWEPQIRVLPLALVRKRAVEAYNDRSSDREASFGMASMDSDKLFLDRITVNFLRHEMSPYDAQLKAVHGRTGVRSAEESFRSKVYQAIAKAYPELSAECSRQEVARLGG